MKGRKPTISLKSFEEHTSLTFIRSPSISESPSHPGSSNRAIPITGRPARGTRRPDARADMKRGISKERSVVWQRYAVHIAKNNVALANRDGERGKLTGTDLLLVIPASSEQASRARAGIQNLDPGLRRGDVFVLTNRSELLATSIKHPFSKEGFNWFFNDLSK